MDDSPNNRPGLLARFAADPPQLRRAARMALLGLVVLVVASRLLPGAAGGWLTALTWVCAPFAAFGIGFGDAFFVRHGRAGRRVLLTIIGSLGVALAACVILAALSGSASSPPPDLLEAALYALLYAGIVLGLAGLIAWGVGRGEDYLSSRIDRMSREDW
jgi:hypothetical protein